jgi:hypothetical protein
MAVPSEGAAHVVCWTAGGKRRFEYFDPSDWAGARFRFEDQVATLAPGRPAINPPYGDVREPGGGIPPQPRLPVGLFHAYRLESDIAPDVFICLYAPAKVLPILGPAKAVDAVLDALPPRGIACDRYAPLTPAEASAPRRPPSEAQRTARAQRALQLALADRTQIQPALRSLSVGELIWVGEEGRRARNPAIATAAAHLALARERTTGGLNLLGGVLRDQYSITRSIEVFRESIDLCESAERNPYGYIGLAASLRRTAGHDEAWDRLKGPLKYYPDNDYALRVKAALQRDRGYGAAA